MTRRKDPSPNAAASLPDPVTVLNDSEMPGSEPEPVPAIDPPAIDLPPPSAPRRRLGILGPVLGGALAATGGFAISHFNLLGFTAPDRSSDLVTLIKALDARLSTQTTALSEATGQLPTIAGRIAALENAPQPQMPDLSPLADLTRRMDAIETLPAGADASTAALAAKLQVLEQRLAAMPATGDNPGLQAELEAALARLTAAETEALDRAKAAEAATMLAARGLALDALSAAIAEGRPFAAELAALADPALTAALTGLSVTGVPSLETLQTDFPDAAREALRLARASDTEAGWGARLVDFLASQTGARSVTPRDGADPDAVLSRAEFALAESRVSDALTELQTLDPAIRSPLDPWITGAGTWVMADKALSAARGQ